MKANSVRLTLGSLALAWCGMMLSLSTAAGEISSGGVLSSLGQDAGKITAILKAILAEQDHASQIRRITAKNNSYFVVDIQSGEACVGHGFEVSDTPEGFLAKVDPSAAFACEE